MVIDGSWLHLQADVIIYNYLVLFISLVIKQLDHFMPLI